MSITDLLGAIVASVLAETVGHGDIALVLDSELDIAGEPCAISFLLLPERRVASTTCWLRSVSPRRPRSPSHGERAHGRNGRVGDRSAMSSCAIGLGSCIGLALVDRQAGVAGLAHVVLPESQRRRRAGRAKFADLAVPELLARARGAPAPSSGGCRR